MENKLVSVIIPAYNAEHTIERAAYSVLNQTHSNVELIIIDDGSKDGTSAICDDIAAKDSRAKVVHIPNGGAANARNTGLDNASGEYISFVDSDDWAEPDMIELLLCAMDCADIAICGISIDFANGTTTTKAPVNNKLYCAGERLELFTSNDTMVIFLAAWNKLFRADIIKRYAIRFVTEYSIMEDSELVLRYMGHVSKVAAITDKCYHYVQTNAQSLTNTASGDEIAANARVITDRMRELGTIWELDGNTIRVIADDLLFSWYKSAIYAKLRDRASSSIAKKRLFTECMSQEGFRDYCKRGVISARVLTAGYALTMCYIKAHRLYMRVRRRKEG